MISTSCFVYFSQSIWNNRIFHFHTSSLFAVPEVHKKNSPVYSWDCGLFSATFFPSDSVQVSVDSSWLFSLQSVFCGCFYYDISQVRMKCVFLFHSNIFFCRFSCLIVVVAFVVVSFVLLLFHINGNEFFSMTSWCRPSVRLVYSSTANWIYQSIWPAFLLKIAGVSMALSVHCENVRKFTNAIIQGIRLLGNDMTTIYSEEWWHTAHCIIAVVKLIDLLPMESCIYLNCHNSYWITKRCWVITSFRIAPVEAATTCLKLLSWENCDFIKVVKLIIVN